jgi:hypothetical protein
MKMYFIYEHNPFHSFTPSASNSAHEFYRLSLDFYGNPVLKVKQLKSDERNTRRPRKIFFFSLELHHFSVCSENQLCFVFVSSTRLVKYSTVFMLYFEGIFYFKKRKN